MAGLIFDYVLIVIGSPIVLTLACMIANMITSLITGFINLRPLTLIVAFFVGLQCTLYTYKLGNMLLHFGHHPFGTLTSYLCATIPIGTLSVIHVFQNRNDLKVARALPPDEGEEKVLRAQMSTAMTYGEITAMIGAAWVLFFVR